MSREDKSFVVDGMLGRLARWLRLLGYDTLYLREEDEEILRIALEEKRVLLTRDQGLYRKAVASGAEAAYLVSENGADQLAQLAKSMGIRLDVDVSRSRCPSCNSPIEPADPSDLRRIVPATVLSRYNEFWKCTGCGKVYWRGSHWRKIGETLTKAKSLLSK